MTPREHIRRLRRFWKSGAVLRECLAAPAHPRWLPFVPADRPIEVRFRSGRGLRMAAGQWPLLPIACRLDRIGARFEFLPDAKRVWVDGLTLYSPLWLRNEASYYKEVLLDDVYAAKQRELSGKTVVDVGAYVGDSALAFARQGATVHALEPSAELCAYLRRNAEENGFAERVIVHEVGLAERAYQAESREGRLRFVEGVDYALARLPRHVELLKLDCEGAEYHLLADPRFLAHLAPREIRMEYHRGPDPLRAQLERAGYAVELRGDSGPLGVLRAQRTEPVPA